MQVKAKMFRDKRFMMHTKNYFVKEGIKALFMKRRADTESNINEPLSLSNNIFNS